MKTVTKYILKQVAANQLSHAEAKIMLLELQELTAKATQNSLASELSGMLGGTDLVDKVVNGNADIDNVPLIPVQSCFFERQFPERRHWNLSVMIYSPESFDAVILKQVLTKIVEHHDALRLVFRETGAGIIQFMRGLDEKLFDLEVLDLTLSEDVERQIESDASRIQGSIDLERGPLLKIGLFKTNHGDHLLVAVHHLVFDGESLKILLEDLQMGYLQVMSGSEIQLPKKTGSFQEWARRIQDYGRSEWILRELDYWRRIDETETLPLPKDHTVTDHRFQWGKIINLILPEEDSVRLLKKIPGGLSIREELLISFGLALQEWTGQEKALIRVIGNGRDLGLAGINLSRTIGWLSISYPVILAPDRSVSLSDCIRKMRDQLRQIPGNGAGYDILRYITLPLRTELPPLTARTEMIFNFLGMFDDAGEDVISPGRIEVSKIPLGFMKSPEGPREYTLVVNALIVERRLKIELDYNRLEYEEGTIRNLGELFLGKVNRILKLGMDGE